MIKHKDQKYHLNSHYVQCVLVLEMPYSSLYNTVEVKLNNAICLLLSLNLIVSVVMSSSHEIKTKDAYLVDCSIGKKNVEMIKNTYDDLIKEGFTVERIVLTHPDGDHCGGFGSIDEFDQMISPPILLTDRFQFKYPFKPFSLKVGRYNESRDTGPFNLSYTSFTSDLVLHTINKIAQPIVHHRDGTFVKDKDDHDNESSIITTITMNNGGNTILACLTGDAFFDNHQMAPFLHNKEIIVFQVPHHGSKHNSNFEFYMKIAENTQYYLISCGHHGSYDFPHKEVFTAIRDATVAKKKEGATIVLTDGTNLNGKKVSSFTGHDHEPSVSYWDPHLRISDCELINKDFLQFTFSSQGDLVNDKPALPNLIQWSIKGYKHMADSYNPKQRLRIHLKASNNSHLVVDALIITEDYQEADDGSIEGFQILSRLKTQQCQGEGCTASIDGYIGLPAPTDPCTWDKRVIMVYGTDDLVFLQLTTGENIIQERKYEHVQKEFEDIITSKVPKNKSSLRKADEYKKIASLLSKAITTIIFKTISTPAQKIELIKEVKEALGRKTDPYYTQIFHQITENHENERDVVMRLLKLEHETRQRLVEDGRAYKGADHTQELQQIEAKNPNLLAPQNIITSFDGEQRFCFFKCYKVPWQIVYGTISDNGDVIWSDHVYNSLQVYTHMTPMNLKLII